MRGNAMSISATEKPLGKIFTSDYRFVIPSFQRAYTWQTENIAQLVTDLQDACHDPDTPYFLGSLILVHDGQTKYQVIDGQQRLISLSIIISVLRDLEDDPELVESLNDLIVEPGDKLRGIKAEPRLKLRERDTNFFRMYVQEGDLEGLFDLRDNDIASHAQRNIAVNTRRTFDLLAAMDAKDRRRFASYLVNGVTLVIVTTDDLAGAHRIFDVMNQLDIFPKDSTATTRVLFVNFGEKEEAFCLPVLKTLRNARINSEIYPEAAKMKKQMTYADKKSIPYVALVGENEINNNVVTLKNMLTGEQESVAISSLVDKLKSEN